MKQFLAVVILGLVVFGLTDARSLGKKRGGRPKGLRSHGPPPAKPCDVNGSTEGFESCREGSTCTSEAVTLTVAETPYAVKVCMADTTPDLMASLMKHACKVETSAETVSPKTCGDDDVCSTDAVSFTHDGEATAAYFCVESDEAFDLVDFLQDLSEHKPRHHQDKPSSESTESEESSEESESEESEESNEMEETTMEETMTTTPALP